MAETEDGPASLADRFRGRSQLLVQHVMFPGCPSCASMTDGYDGIAVHRRRQRMRTRETSSEPRWFTGGERWHG